MTNEKDTIVEKGKLSDKQTVYTTEKVKTHYPTVGTPVELHPHQAKAWIESGKATTKEPAKATTKA